MWQVERGRDKWKTLTVQQCLNVEKFFDGGKVQMNGDFQVGMCESASTTAQLITMLGEYTNFHSMPLVALILCSLFSFSSNKVPGIRSRS